jgi:hypothetical protein
MLSKQQASLLKHQAKGRRDRILSEVKPKPEPKPITMGEAFRGFDLNVYKQEKFE